MPTSELSVLNQTFALPGHLRFERHPSGLVFADIDSPKARASIFLQGAQLAQWTPQGHEPVVWLSPAAVFAPGKALRGGVPVCWPWFGDADAPGLPAHGFARTAVWAVAGTELRADGAVCLSLDLPPNPALWPHDTPLSIRFAAGETLAIELTTRNQGKEPAVVGQALHTYFHVSDARRIGVFGLEGCAYFDKLDGRRKQQAGPVLFDGEVDRVFEDEGGDCVIEDTGLGRRIRVAKRGSRSTIVWNPWFEKAERLGDLGPEGHLRMVCVESANAGADVLRLAPGAAHCLAVEYRVEGLR